MDFATLESVIKTTFEDFKLSTNEKFEFRELLNEFCDNVEALNFARNRAFDLVNEQIRTSKHYHKESLNWLEHIVRCIDSVKGGKNPTTISAYFSPGNNCLHQIISLCKQAKHSIDICVFTISDDRISHELVNAHKRKIRIRILTDNDKSNDLGSDIDYFDKQGIPVTMDISASHMHHKFAIFDKKILVNGSFNWTRSASKYNEENIIILSGHHVVNSFISVFNKKWDEFSNSSIKGSGTW